MATTLNEYLDIEDGDTIWRFDTHFLLSKWTCIFGNGCPGAHGQAEIGCCTIGAHFQDDEDLDRVIDVVDKLAPGEFTNGDMIFAGGKASTENWLTLMVTESGNRRERLRAWFKRTVIRKAPSAEDYKTLIVNDACIFANRADHPNGAGCGLHQAAVKRGARYQDYKPFVCSWAPLFVLMGDANDAGEEADIRVVTRFENRYWNDEGYEFNDWWCLDSADAYVSDSRVYQHMEYELRMMVGDSVYSVLKTNLDNRLFSGQGVPVTIGKRHGDGFAERLKGEPLPDYWATKE